MKGVNIIFCCAVILLVTTIFSGCEKGFDYSKPDDAPTRKEYNESVNNLLQKKDSLWITDQMDKRARSFRVGFEFTGNKETKIYYWNFVMVSIVDQLIAAYYKAETAAQRSEINNLIQSVGGLEDGRLRDLLINNPANAGIKAAIEKYVPVRMSGPPYKYFKVQEEQKSYNINGDFQTNLTFDSQSILSDLKQIREFDFDFVVQKINSKKLDLFGHYGSNANRNPILMPIAKDDLKSTVNAANILNVYPGAIDLVFNGQLLSTISIEQIKSFYTLSNDMQNQKVAFKLDEELDVSAINNMRFMVSRNTDFTFNEGGASAVSGTVLAKFYLYDGKSYNESNVLELIAR